MAADTSADRGGILAVDSFGTLGKVWLGFLGLLILGGAVAWFQQIQLGLAATGMRNVFSWGLYIMLFVLFVGLSAGGLIISSAPKFFHSDKYESLARFGVLLSLGCIAVAGLMILPDLGRPGRIYQFITSPDVRSPMVWDFTIVLLYGLFNVGYLWLLTRRDLAARGSSLALGVKDTIAGRKRDRKLAFWSAAFALPLAVMLHSVTGWIFATQMGRGDWFSPLVAPTFIAKALVSGLGLLLVAAIAADRLTNFEFDAELRTRLGKFLGVFLAIHVVYLLAAERLPHAWASNFEFWAITSGFLIGDTSYFWLWTVVGGAIPIALLAIPSLRKQAWAVLVAGGLAVFGVVFEGVRLIFVGYESVNISLAPGVSVGDYGGLGSTVWAVTGVYTPTLIEIVVAAGLMAFGALIVTLGLRIVPVQSQSVREPTMTDGGTEK
ncbi:polysulfide reductase NrfD [Halodesulfurarchaeum formicicum]|uniref:Polysulfide reductase NrfD n=1 Tax=Halodesulfurarchaeum formicicum TaxID=1873524 RepID=A0A1D8S301_9EURY|nr:NrfD/PsrC family molybdoenzyme membrane anchor subunit [Halodesulfurarchaeum formicicum]AOW79711.1 polysulfide reductase NrfD [Halodesulfurarchaeum formicicum]APE94961.1 polysulfide reductase NrfD [Halodesulfurarchaeum formicicum]